MANEDQEILVNGMRLGIHVTMEPANQAQTPAPEGEAPKSGGGIMGPISALIVVGLIVWAMFGAPSLHIYLPW